MILNIKIIAPDRTVWETEAEEAILPSSTGQIGILSGHAPLLTALDIGVMRVRVSDKWVPLALMGGFVEVENDTLTLLINAAEQGSSIDLNAAESELEKAIARSNEATSPKQIMEAKRSISKARTRLQAATLAKG